MFDVFISYSREDSRIASEIASRLTAAGLSIFFDRDSLVAGESFSESIGKALGEARAVVVLLSGNSTRSRWVEEELTHSLEGGKLVVPVLLDAEAKNNWVWPLVANRQALTLDRDSETEQLDRLAQDLRRAIRPATFPEVPIARMASPAAIRHPQLWMVAVAIASAVVGGVVVWLLR